MYMVLLFHYICSVWIHCAIWRCIVRHMAAVRQPGSTWPISQETTSIETGLSRHTWGQPWVLAWVQRPVLPGNSSWDVRLGGRLVPLASGQTPPVPPGLTISLCTCQKINDKPSHMTWQSRWDSLLNISYIYTHTHTHSHARKHT